MLRDNDGRHGNGHAPAMNVSDCSNSTANSVDMLRDPPSVRSSATLQPLHARSESMEIADSRCDVNFLTSRGWRAGGPDFLLAYSVIT